MQKEKMVGEVGDAQTSVSNDLPRECGQNSPIDAQSEFGALPAAYTGSRFDPDAPACGDGGE